MIAYLFPPRRSNKALFHFIQAMLRGVLTIGTILFTRIRVKICGITNLPDALLAAELGADALGFIFYPKSPRYIAPSAAGKIIAHLPPFVTTVAVMVNESLEGAREILAESGCRMAQLHGEESPEYLRELGFPAIKALSVATTDDLAILEQYPYARAFLLDTKVPGQRGGTGITFDWTLAREARRFNRPIILAGGLSPENVGQALETAAPFGIDISSGIEISPGRKDLQRMVELFTAVREADARRSQRTNSPLANSR